MKFFHQLKTIDLPPDQWRQVLPWPVRTLLALLAVVDWCSHCWLRLNQTVTNGRTTIRAAMGIATIALIALRVTAQVTWNDLIYSLANSFVNDQLTNLSAVA